jgi:hypothetical protein
MFKLRTRLQELAEKISLRDWPDLAGGFDLDEDSLFNLNIGHRGNNLFLGYYTQSGLKMAMDKYKVTRKLALLGFDNIQIIIDTSDAFKHKLLLNNRIGGKTEKLVEFVVKRDFVEVEMPFKTPLNGIKFEVLVVEWLKMQNPRKEFPRQRQKLPGQEYPGLGIGSDALELLVLATKRLGLKGIVNIPDHYHNAFFYSRIFYFEKPKNQARLLAVMDTTRKMSVGEAAWLIEQEKIIDKSTGMPFKWEIARQILPLEKKWRKLYQSSVYKNHVTRIQKNYNLFIKK